MTAEGLIWIESNNYLITVKAVYYIPARDVHIPILFYCTFYFFTLLAETGSETDSPGPVAFSGSGPSVMRSVPF